MSRAHRAPEAIALARVPAAGLQAPGAPTLSEADRTALRALWADARAEATLRAYRADWEDWVTWCGLSGNSPLPAHPVAVALYLQQLVEGGARPGTAARRVAALHRAHELASAPSPSGAPEVREALRALRRLHGAGTRRKKAIDLDLLRRMLMALAAEEQSAAHRGYSTDPMLRDRALLLVGYFGAFRRSEHTTVTTGQIERVEGGVIVHLDQSKTNQTGADEPVPLAVRPEEPALCPVAALDAWLAARATWARDDDYVFFGWSPRGGTTHPGHINPKEVNRLVKRLLAASGVDPAPYGAHSLRAGFVTQALRDGANVGEVQDVTRHKDVRTLMGYRREEDIVARSAATRIGRPGAARPSAAKPGAAPAPAITLDRLFPVDAPTAVARLGAILAEGRARLTPVAFTDRDVPAQAARWLAAVGLSTDTTQVLRVVAADTVAALLAAGWSVLFVPDRVAVGLPYPVGFLFSALSGPG